jgi:hypothetical protein
MSPIETATLVASAVVIIVGVPLAVFHRAIARELRHLRAHFQAHGKAEEQAKHRGHHHRA